MLNSVIHFCQFLFSFKINLLKIFLFTTQNVSFFSLNWWRHGLALRNDESLTLNSLSLSFVNFAISTFASSFACFNFIAFSKKMSHTNESSISNGYSRLLAWSKSFFASPSASRSLWIPSLCDAILKSLYGFFCFDEKWSILDFFYLSSRIPWE